LDGGERRIELPAEAGVEVLDALPTDPASK
jgi:hypothetical protein